MLNLPGRMMMYMGKFGGADDDDDDDDDRECFI